MNNKNYSLRLVLIDRCLRKARGFTVIEMMDFINNYFEERGMNPVRSKQTIQNDMVQLENDYYTTIERLHVGQTVRYRYEDRSFSITSRDLTMEDFQRMDRLMRQFNYAGSHFLHPVAEAIERKYALKIVYGKFMDEKPHARIVYPYYLLPYHERWYMLAWNVPRQKLSVFGLDRIVSVERADGEPFREMEGNPADYFEDMVGVTRNEGDEPQEVRLRVAKEQLNYIQTRKIHQSQEIVGQDGDWAELRLRVIVNYELEQELLQYGEKVVVVSPSILRERMKERIGRAWGVYSVVRPQNT
ncbi:MAG: WYL domain-containing protein [Prevotella sp.]|nr:WYL domain-containing protein [Prevotella sp.]